MFDFPQIKGQHIKAAGFFLLIAGLPGCGSDGEPMPFDDQSLDQFTYHFEEVFEASKDDIRAIDNDRIRARTLVADVYIPVIEDELGYDFDLTMRHYRFYREGTNSRDAWRRQMDDAYLYFRNNYTDAHEHKLISKAAFELFAFEEKADDAITENQGKILAYITKCQEQNGGACTVSALDEVLPQDIEELNTLVPYVDVQDDGLGYDPTYRMDRIKQAIYLAIADWVKTASGETGFTAIPPIRYGESFSIDPETVEISGQFNLMLDEERKTLGLEL